VVFFGVLMDYKLNVNVYIIGLLSSWPNGLTRATLALFAQDVPGSTPGPDKLDSGFHPFEVSEMNSN